MYKLRHIFIALLMLALLPSAAFAEGTGFGFGWQHTGAASGLSLKLPLDRYLLLQPMLSLSVKGDASGTLGHAAYGLRSIIQLPSLGPLHPYAGVGAGRSTQYSGAEPLVTSGYEGFVGLEYDIKGLRPSLELAMSHTAHSDGSSYTGTTYNFGLHYYF